MSMARPEGATKPRQRLLYVYASLSRLDFQGFFENAILVFLGITDFPPSKKPTFLMMHLTGCKFF
jgi:hypothetical protein